MELLSMEEQARVKAMLKQGMTHSEIANALKVNSLVVSAFIRRTSRRTESCVVPGPQDPKTRKERIKESATATGVLVGVRESGGKVYWDPTSTANPHLMIVGESGTGKTYAMTALMAELRKGGFPGFVLDYSNSYHMHKFPGPVRRAGLVRELQVASDGLCLNPMRIRRSDILGPDSVAVRIAGTFERIYNLGIQQRTILRDAIIEVFRRSGITKGRRDSWASNPPHLSQLNILLDELSQDEEYARRATADSLRAHISDFFIYNTFRSTGLHFDWQQAIEENSITVLQLHGMEGTPKKVVVDFLLWDLFNFMMDTGEKSLTAFVLLDEAHNLSFRDDSPVEKILREARKYGFGAIIASQQPEDFSEVSFSNTNTKICFQVSAERGQFLKKLAARGNYSLDELRQVLTTLNKYHAFVLSGNEGSTCRILSFEERSF